MTVREQVDELVGQMGTKVSLPSDEQIEEPVVECTLNVEREVSMLRAISNVATVYGTCRCRLAVVTAYLDESGIHEGDHLCVVAGFMGDESNWLPFIQDWTSALGQRRNLHMKDLRWAQHPDRVERLLRKLGPIPRKHGLQPIVGGMWHKDYADLVRGRIHDAFATPYMFAMQACIAQTLRLIPPAELIQFVFEKQRGYEWAAQVLHDAVFKMSDPRVQGISFQRQDATVCIDPADCLAFQVREYKTNPQSEKARMGMPILGDGSMIGHIWSREEISRMVEEFIAKGVLLPEGKIVLPFRRSRNRGQK